MFVFHHFDAVRNFSNGFPPYVVHINVCVQMSLRHCLQKPTIVLFHFHRFSRDALKFEINFFRTPKNSQKVNMIEKLKQCTKFRHKTVSR